MVRALNRIGRKWRAAKWAFLRATRRNITVRTQQGLLSVCTQDNVISRRLYCDGHYQYDLTLRALNFLRGRGLVPPRGQGVVLDVGANNGVISIGMLVNGEVEAAVGIEPGPENFALLQQNIAGNNLASRYTALQVAASDRTGNLRFELSRKNFGDHRVQALVAGTAVPELNDESSRAVINVAASPMDEIIAKLPRQIGDGLGLIWIDVQGHEGYVFAGGSELFARNIPVVTEVWPYGIKRSGMTLEQFCANASRYWPSFWVWRRCGDYVRYSTSTLLKFCEELGDQGEFDDVIFTHE